MGFCERILVLEPELLVVGEVGPQRRQVFLLSDNCSPVAISLSSNHSLRAATVYASTEVGTMMILLLFLQKQNLAFAVYLLGSVLSLPD